MDIKPITQDISVTGQIDPQDLAAIAAAGFRTVICNRPDGETPDQPAFAQIQSAAQDAGLKTVLVPISGPPVPREAIEQFAAALEASDGPTLAFCRSGMRSTMLWALSQAGSRPTDEIIAAAASAGYDLSPLAPMLNAAA